MVCEMMMMVSEEKWEGMDGKWIMRWYVDKMRSKEWLWVQDHKKTNLHSWLISNSITSRNVRCWYCRCRCCLDCCCLQSSSPPLPLPLLLPLLDASCHKSSIRPDNGGNDLVDDTGGQEVLLVVLLLVVPLLLLWWWWCDKKCCCFAAWSTIVIFDELDAGIVFINVGAVVTS